MATNRLMVVRRHLSAVNQTFKAVECQQLKQPLVLVTKTLNPVANDEIRIRTRACGLNYATYLTLRGEYQVKVEPPFNPGNELSGEVVAVGNDVSRCGVGDVVFGVLISGGALQEYVTVTESMLDMGALYKIQAKSLPCVNHSKLAALPANYGTAWQTLTRKGKVSNGDIVLVTGASGGVGLALVELASKVLNCQVIALCQRAKEQQVKASGAHLVIDYNSYNIRQQIKSFAPDGINVICDTVGGDGAIDLIKSLAYEGRYVTIGYTAGIPKIPANLLLLKAASAVGVWWGNTMQKDPEAFKESIDSIAKLYLDKRIDPYVQQSLPIEKVNEAFDLLGSRKVVGKVIIEM